MEGKKSYNDAADEIVNDALGALLTTDEGIESFAKWVYSDTGRTQAEKKTLVQRIKDAIARIVAGLKRLLKGKKLNEGTERFLSMELEQQEALRQKFYSAMDAAAKNAKEGNYWESGAAEGAQSGLAVSAYREVDLSNDSSVYTYDFLTALPDMPVTVLPPVSDVRNSNDRVETGVVVEMGRKNARSVGTVQDGKMFVRNRYTGRPIQITAESIRHSLDGSENRILTNSRLGAVIGDVVKNAVPINAMYNKAKGVSGTYAMAAYAADDSDRQFIAIVTIEEWDGNVIHMEAYDVAHSVSGRQKRGSGRQKKGSQADTKSQGFYPIKAAKISIADVLRIVNSTHQSVLSENVLKTLGERRNPTGEYADRVKFSINPDSDSISPDRWKNAEKLDPQEITTQNEVRDPGMRDYLVQQFEENGWDGRPIVAYDNGGNGYVALTGSHRVAAAAEAGIQVPAVLIESREAIARLADTYSDEERAMVADELLEEGEIDQATRDLLVRENDLNNENFDVPYSRQARYSVKSGADTPSQEQRWATDFQLSAETREAYNTAAKEVARTEAEVRAMVISTHAPA